MRAAGGTPKTLGEAVVRAMGQVDVIALGMPVLDDKPDIQYKGFSINKKEAEAVIRDFLAQKFQVEFLKADYKTLGVLQRLFDACTKGEG